MLDYKVLIKFIEEFLVSVFFKKNKLSFVREVNGILQILEVQKYTFKIEDKSAFTINIGLVLPNTFQQVFGKTITPSVSEGVIYFNAGELINNFNGRIVNKYWILEDDGKLKSELLDFFSEKVIPFFDSINTIKEILVFAEQNRIVSKSTASVKMQLDELKHKNW